MSPENGESRLVSCQWLADHLGDPNVRIIEVSSSQSDAKYRESHLPGSAWWNWKDACWHATDREFATPEEMARRLGAIGVGPDTTVVLVGDPVQYGTYAFWALTMAGHRDVRLLDGARTRWTAEGRPLETTLPSFSAVQYPPPAADTSSRVGRDDVRAKLGQPGRLILDVRSPEEYSGERVSPASMMGGVDHGAERTGRIPGAVHLFYKDLLNDDDTFLPADQLRAIFAGAGVTDDSSDEVVVYCRLSHRATLAWVAMKHILGMGNVRIYDGSWTEWGSIVGFPIER
ncbi:MAG: sulfurtransferase [Chloroflexi bacterium]|nr:sulfurtransferase [Chloroflexota bacterium]